MWGHGDVKNPCKGYHWQEIFTRQRPQPKPMPIRMPVPMPAHLKEISADGPNMSELFWVDPVNPPGKCNLKKNPMSPHLQKGFIPVCRGRYWKSFWGVQKQRLIFGNDSPHADAWDQSPSLWRLSWHHNAWPCCFKQSPPDIAQSWNKLLLMDLIICSFSDREYSLHEKSLMRHDRVDSLY